MIQEKKKEDIFMQYINKKKTFEKNTQIKREKTQSRVQKFKKSKEKFLKD